MTATERLRAMLDERGVEWTYKDGTVRYESNGHWHLAWVYNDDKMVKMVVSMGYLTPEQAIAATLDAGTCHMSFVDEYETVSGEEEYLCECSECGYRRWEPAHDLPLFCSKCGRNVEYD